MNKIHKWHDKNPAMKMNSCAKVDRVSHWKKNVIEYTIVRTVRMNILMSASKLVQISIEPKSTIVKQQRNSAGDGAIRIYNLRRVSVVLGLQNRIRQL